MDTRVGKTAFEKGWSDNKLGKDYSHLYMGEEYAVYKRGQRAGAEDHVAYLASKRRVS